MELSITMGNHENGRSTGAQASACAEQPVGFVAEPSPSSPPQSETRPIRASTNEPGASASGSPEGGRSPVARAAVEPVAASRARPSSGAFRSSIPNSIDGLVADLPRPAGPSPEQLARRARLQRIVVVLLATFGVFDMVVLWWISR